MKVLILGLTGSGKSTCAKVVASKFFLKIVEADDEVLKLNDGIWPKEESIIDKYFEIANDKVLGMSNVLYLISWLEKERIKEFFQKGFKIIELRADFDELLRRKRKRGNLDLKEARRFKNNYQGYLKIVNDSELKSAFLLRLDTTSLAPNQVEKLIIKTLFNLSK